MVRGQPAGCEIPWPGETITNEQGAYDPETIKKYHCNVAEAQLELHRQTMEWCIGTIAKARNKHVDCRARARPQTEPAPDPVLVEIQ